MLFKIYNFINRLLWKGIFINQNYQMLRRRTEIQLDFQPNNTNYKIPTNNSKWNFYYQRGLNKGEVNPIIKF